MAEKKTSRGPKPTHELKVKVIEGSDQARIGVAWENDNGSFTIRLQPCTSLTYDNLKDKTLTLWPIRSDEEWARWHAMRERKEKEKEAAAAAAAAAKDPQE